MNVLDNKTTSKFLELLQPLLSFLIPQFAQEGKADLTIGVGCTGGKHRSVALAEELGRRLSASRVVHVRHRDRLRG